jgi:hypothetical protein
MKTQGEFIEELLNVEPALREVFDQHIRDNGEVLPHVFMGDVTRFVISAAARRNSADPTLPKLIHFLETRFAVAGEDIKNLISVSFVENLVGEDEALGVLVPMMGPYLREEVERSSD